jgi:hypothetical protein
MAARTRTLTQLLEELRYLTDIEGQTQRHTDANLTRQLNQSIAAYRRAHPEWYATTATGVTTANTAALPALTTPATAWDTVDRIIRLSITTPDSVTTVLYPFETVERHDYSLPYQVTSQWPTMYRREGSASVVLIPTPQAAFPVQVYYLPQQTDLSGANDVFDPVMSGGEQWVIYDCAARVALRDMSPRATALMALREETAKGLATGARQPEPQRRVDSWGRRLTGNMRGLW